MGFFSSLFKATKYSNPNRGFEKGKRTKKDGSHNNTFDKTDAQKKAMDEGRVGRPSKK